MKIDRSKNSKRNITIGIINRFVAIVVPFITRTVLLKTLGTEYLGLNSLFSSILQVLNLSELGFGSAVVFVLYKPIANDDYIVIQGILSFLRRIYRYIGLSIALLGVISMPFLPILIEGHYPDGINIYILFSIYIANSAGSYLFGGYRVSVLNSIQRNDIVLTVQTIIQLITGVIQNTILLTVGSYYLFLIFVPVLTVTNNIVIWILTNRLYPTFFPKGSIDPYYKQKIIKKVKGLMVNNICQVSRNSIDSICISSFLGLTVTAIYNNYYYIISALITVSNVLTTSLLAGIGNSIVVETREKNYADMKRINYVYMTYVAVTTICLMNLIQPFMRIWVGSGLTYNEQFVWILSAYYYALNMGNIRALYSDAAGLWLENRCRAIIETIANILLNIVLVRFMGLFGIVLATFLTIIFINFGFGSSIIFKHYFRNTKFKEYIMISIYMAIIALFSCIVIGRAVSFIICDDSIMTIVLRGIICVILGTLLITGINMINPSYREAINWLKRNLKD